MSSSLDFPTNEPTATPTVTITDDTVAIERLVLTDGVVAGLVAREPEESRSALLVTMLQTGARGMMSMGLGLDLSEVDERVRMSVTGITTEAERTVRALLTEARTAMEAALDPDHRQSILARAYAEFETWRTEFLDQVDPDRETGHAGRLVGRLEGMLGPEGDLARRLSEALDPDADDSAFSTVSRLIERRFTELRDLLIEERGRRKEAEFGTRKGFEYEDQLEADLREACRPLGAIVERTSASAGLASTDALVGDFTVTLPGETRVVIEAKHTRAIALTGADGILTELDRAMANRGATVGICVSKDDAYPQEVGPFGVYGNRILVVDDGEGTLLRVALRWAHLVAMAAARDEAGIDVAAITDRLDRIRQLAQLFKSNRRALTGISGSIEQVRASLDTMRTDLLELLDDLDRELRSDREATVVPMARPTAS